MAFINGKEVLFSAVINSGYNKGYEQGKEEGYREGYIDATSGTAFEIDESTAYRKIVPSASEKWAQVLKLGGMSYKTKNLIPSSLYNTKTTTSNGITYTVNADGTITANGTATATSQFLIIPSSANYILKNGTYTVSGCPSGGDVSTYYFQTTAGTEVGNGRKVTYSEDAQFYMNITIKSGTKVENLVFAPMLNEGTTARPYEPYFEGIRDAKVTELVSEGKNLFDISQALNDVLVDNGDGTYTISNKGNGNRFAKKVAMFIPANTPIAFKGIKVSDGDAKPEFQIVFADGSSESYPMDGYSRTRTFTRDVTAIQIYLGIPYTGQSATFADFQIVYGTEATEYTPYVGTIATNPIPEAIQKLDGYGLGVNETYYNYIDYERKVFVPKVIKVTFDGSDDENWQVGGNASQLMKIDIAQSAINLAPCLANSLNGKTIGANSLAEGEFMVSTNSIYLRKETVTNPDGNTTDANKLVNWRTWLANNPLIVVYVPETPIEIDITEYVTEDNLIEVQGGGSITAVNEHSLGAPSTIQFVKKVGV